MPEVTNPPILRVIPFLITACLIAFPAHAKYSGGSATAEDPYQIATTADLIVLGESPDDYDKHFILTADIDLDPNLPGRKVFDKAVIAPEPPWEGGIPFTGILDGSGHTISQLTITGGDYLGLFGRLDSGAIVSDLRLEAVRINGTGDWIGALAGENEYGSSITTSSSTGVVSGDGAVGGLIGRNVGSVTGSYSACTVTGNRTVGGLAGANSGDIAASGSSATVVGEGHVGGLVGQNGSSITTSYSTGMVTGNDSVGGLVGENRGYGGCITATYSAGAVRGKSLTGGLVGANYYRSSIAASYSTAAVTGETYVGGLVGINMQGVITTGFWDVETSGQPSSDGGTGQTTAEMQDTNTFLGAGWDFVDEIRNGTCDYWQISPNEYPRLRYQAGENPAMPEGLGTAEQPYLIRDARDLGMVWLKPLAHYRLEASVDLSKTTWSTAVIPWFDGAFDGNGHTISNIHVEGGSYLGLFGVLSFAAEVANLHLDAVDVNGSGDWIGGLAGRSGGHIGASHSGGTVTGHDLVGGLVGENTGSISAGSSAATIRGGSAVGGLVGVNDGRITTSHGTGTTAGDEYVGGLAGANLWGSITISCSAGAVTGNQCIGGLVGQNSQFSKIGASYSGASVSGNSLVGGFAGDNWGTINASYSAGPVSGTASNVGGFVGSGLEGRRGKVTGCFWDTQISGQAASSVGTGKTTTEMQTAQTFLDAGWDFVGETANGTEDIWWIDEGRDYPRLWWEAATEEIRNTNVEIRNKLE